MNKTLIDAKDIALVATRWQPAPLKTPNKCERGREFYDAWREHEEERHINKMLPRGEALRATEGVSENVD